jgi:hypothetical protein
MKFLKALFKTLASLGAVAGLLVATPALANPYTPQEIYEAYVAEQAAYAAYMDANDAYQDATNLSPYDVWYEWDQWCTYTYMQQSYNPFDWHDCQDAALAWYEDYDDMVQELYNAYIEAQIAWIDAYDVWYWRYTHPI